MSTSKYEFSMLSNPIAVNFHEEDWNDNGKTGVPIKSYAKILFKDSLFSFYPYAEIHYKDSGGQIVDNIYFVEGLEFACKLGYPKETDPNTNLERGGYLEHQYVWSANEINSIHMSNSISGNNVFMLISKHYMYDYPRSRVFNHENSTTKRTITDILKTVILPELKFIDPKKYFISDSTGKPYVAQSNINNKTFISKLSEYTFSQNSEVSGYYTFINCNGEFYFMTINDMLNQKPVMNYKIDLVVGMTYDEIYIKDFRVLQGGLPVNFNNYRRKFYRYLANGTLALSTDNDQVITTLANKNKTSAKSKLLIRNQYIPTGKDYSKHTYAGIQDEENGLEFYKGFTNQFYRDTALCYRMIIIVQFNPLLVSGKTVSIELTKQNKNNEIAKEFTGNWLICEASHIMDNNGIPYSQLTISKPQVEIDNDHIFLKDFK